MKECIEEGTLQSYFDGELSREEAESVAAHVTACVSCARASRELENESLLLTKALEAEFAAPVPTERLRHRVEAAVAGLQVVRPLATRGSAGWLQSVVDLFTLSPQRAFGYAGLAAVIVLAAIFAVVQMRRAPVTSKNDVVRVQDKNPTPGPTGPAKDANPTAASTAPQSGDDGVKHIAAVQRPQRPSGESAPPKVKLLPGERSYLKTIASLHTALKSEATMSPALQAEYEHNLALVDRAIAATRTAAKKNPNDPDAAEFMFAAYQSKVDLLNQVADARLSNRREK